jgi:excinuclease ABC subunit A
MRLLEEDIEINDEINSSTRKQITIIGAKEHNLKNISLTIPRNKLVVITGLSGSGKSSLAFDTLYAEGQRRYVECLSAYARQFLGMLKKPDVDVIEGLSPAISIEQKSISHNPRSTVGTVTEIYDYLRLLFAKIGVQYCTECNIPVQQKTLDQITDKIMNNFSKCKIQILSPLIKGRKGHYRELFEQLQKQGYTKARVDGKIIGIEDDMELSRYKIHNIELVVDRLIVEPKNENRLSESLELSLHRGDGTSMLLVDRNGTTEEILFNTSYSCPSCGKSYQTPAPNMFSFNSPFGSCKTCAGLGEIHDFNLDLVIPDYSISIAEGGIAPIGKNREMWLWNQIKSFCNNLSIDMEIPISKIDEDKIIALLYGTESNKTVDVKYQLSSSRFVVYKHKFVGILPSLRHQFDTTSSAYIKNSIEMYMSAKQCPECHGGRLKQENLSIRVDEKSIQDIVQQNIADLHNYFATLSERLSERELLISHLIIKEIESRLKFLENVGLAYLDLDRTIRTLSGGESQRIRLASQIGSELVGIMYVLDEPSIGLHQHDNNKLISSLQNLRDLGNSVIVVEHDKSMIESADYVIDIGPGAGVNGGEILFTCEPKNFKKLSEEVINKSLTAQYILDKKKIEFSKKRREGNGKFIKLSGAKGNNLKNVNLNIPLGKLVCITGKSGSGKSSLINDTLYPILSKHFYRSSNQPLPYSSVEGLENIDKVIEIDQSPIGRTPRSNPVTYTGVFTLIRDFYTLLPDSKIKGYKTGRFSFNVPGGRCDECEGGGIKKIEMNFLPDVYVTCDACNGKRYNDETLTVTYKGKSISDVLEMTVEEACEFFSEIPKIKSKLDTLNEVGLGYIKLGQQAPTLSGGEAQRVKLATELSKRSTGQTLYLMDEPTTGLHFEDINILLKLLNRLTDKGNTIIIIEHNLEVIMCADWLIDLGPEGGQGGGEIIAEGTPEDIKKVKKSYTGQALKKLK